jgi:Xaa-Pro aminopeptidase
LRNHFKQLTVVAVVLMVAVPAFGQYTDKDSFARLGGSQEFARRRAALLTEMKSGYAILTAKIVAQEGAHYREDNDFYYFTGVADPGAVLVMDATTKRAMLFEPVQPERLKQVLGRNVLSLPESERKEFGFTAVMPLEMLIPSLTQMIGSGGDVWMRLGFGDRVDGARPEVGNDYAAVAAHPLGSTMPGDRGAISKVRQMFPAANLKDMTPMIDAMRLIKTPQEIEILRRNAKVSAEGIRRAIARAKAGQYEYEIEAEAFYWFYKNGAKGMAYPAIASSGPNVNTIHYFQNRRKTQPNDLIVLDFAGDMDQLAMDITRTFNIGGKFTPEQAKWYAVDLETQKAIISMLKPGNTYEQAGAAGKAVYDKAGIGDQFHGMGPQGHFVGMATHDVTRPTGPIKVGQVLTVEPYIDLPDRQIHVRVEDTVLITENGAEILSSGVPKEMADVEKLVGSEAK